MKTVQIGFLGCGNIGGGVYELLTSFTGEIAHRQNTQLRIKRMLVRSLNEPRAVNVPSELLTTRAEDILSDPEISIVAEFMGGEEPATTYLERALLSGKTVVTANKMAVALGWQRLHEAAVKSGAGLYYEAAVCGAIPVIRALNDSLQGNRIQTIMGIVNGTTNYILSTMRDKKLPYAEVLAQAKQLGLAEPDPSSDVEGYDAAYKLSILSSLAFHARVPYRMIYREGIAGIDMTDIEMGRELGYTLKLLALAKREGSTLDARVHPAFIPDAHPLASVSGSYNAVFVHGHACENLMFYGRGAGSAPTSSAIVGDILYAVSHPNAVQPTFGISDTLNSGLTITDDWRCGFYIRLTAKDSPGVLGHVAERFGRQNVSIKALLQRGEGADGRVPIVLITHEAHEKEVRAALRAMDPALASPESVIRVEGGHHAA